MDTRTADRHAGTAVPHRSDPAGIAERCCNWGRWGDDDQLGTLHHITDDVRARAAAEARTGRTVSLAADIVPVPLAGAPTPFGTAAVPSAVHHVVTYTGTPPRAVTDLLMINTHHVGLTHLDALGHIVSDGRIYPGRSVQEVLTPGGLRMCAVDAMRHGVVTRGVLLDLAPVGVPLTPDHRITPEELETAAAREAVEVRPGDALAVRAGWPPAGRPGPEAPGLSLEAVAWLYDRSVSLYLGDVGDPLPHRPPSRPGEFTLPLHQIGLARMGMPLVDSTDLEELAATCAELGRYSFLLAVAPLPIEGATGCPINPLAIF